MHLRKESGPFDLPAKIDEWKESSTKPSMLSEVSVCCTLFLELNSQRSLYFLLVETMRKIEVDDAAIMKQMMMNTIRRMTTPILEGNTNEEDQIDQAVIVLQKVIRGRATQSMVVALTVTFDPNNELILMK
jgi:hypothetical protein